MLKEKQDIKSHYDSEGLIKGYVQNRFSKPLGKFLHERETSIVNLYIQKSNAESVLDLACGPARLTVDIETKNGTAFDNAKNMLSVAKKRLKGKKWKFVQGDAFNLKLKNKLDLIYSFRFFRHFNKEDRKSLLANVHSHLNDNSIFITDMANIKFRDRSLKQSNESIDVVDYKIEKKEFIQELEDAGFEIIEIDTVINHYNLQVNASRLYYLNLDSVAMALIREFERYPPFAAQEFVFIARKK